jgi:hypothetical protein
MTPLEAYLTSLREIRSSGEAVDETSYYGALETFLNEIGKTLKPKVRCVLQLRNRGAGNPDGGLFTEDQLKKRKEEEKSLPQNPARGVIEIKPTSDDAWVTAEGEQVSRYWGKYRLVLVTNYRDFVIVGQDPFGRPANWNPIVSPARKRNFGTPQRIRKKLRPSMTSHLPNTHGVSCFTPPHSQRPKTSHRSLPPTRATR